LELAQYGASEEEIAECYPQPNLSQVYAALAYYHANRAEVEQELADELTEFDRLQARQSQASQSS
jgi:uncharacterized protein (DUF433 family)